MNTNIEVNNLKEQARAFRDEHGGKTRYYPSMDNSQMDLMMADFTEQQLAEKEKEVDLFRKKFIEALAFMMTAPATEQRIEFYEQSQEFLKQQGIAALKEQK